MDSAGHAMWLFFWIVMITIALFLMSCCGCSHFTVPAADGNAYQAEADAVVAMAFAADPIDPTQPDPGPDDNDDQPKPGDKCPQCDGSGRSGDGLGRCRKCGGDGRIDERDIRSGENRAASNEPDAGDLSRHSQRSDLATSHSTRPQDIRDLVTPEVQSDKYGSITLHITDENQDGYAVEWWREIRPKIGDRWDVHVVKDIDPTAKQPWFDVCTADRCYQTKRVTLAQIEKLESKLSTQRNSQ